jgi:hypothetical protein
MLSIAPCSWGRRCRTEALPRQEGRTVGGVACVHSIVCADIAIRALTGRGPTHSPRSQNTLAPEEDKSQSRLASHKCRMDPRTKDLSQDPRPSLTLSRLEHGNPDGSRADLSPLKVDSAPSGSVHLSRSEAGVEKRERERERGGVSEIDHCLAFV